jgi:uncharacterized protein YabN with tetrapyrrole methylase and pyrophosphatase domain
VREDALKDTDSFDLASELQARAAAQGFDWPDLEGILDKIQEELGELRRELAKQPHDGNAVFAEMGDLLFVIANLCRRLGLKPEDALHAAILKFQRRYAHVETSIRISGRNPRDVSLEEMEALWQQAKSQERGST